MQKKALEISVGLFMILGILALVFLALKVSGLSDYRSSDYYVIYAQFDNVGDLKPRAPVTIGGVRIGQVGNIALDPATFKAKVSLYIDKDQNELPTDSSASIYTQGLLGSNYVNISPGFDNTYLKNGESIENTNSALILERLIGQFLFNAKK